jgi:hypothetical protein
MSASIEERAIVTVSEIVGIDLDWLLDHDFEVHDDFCDFVDLLVGLSRSSSLTSSKDGYRSLHRVNRENDINLQGHAGCGGSQNGLCCQGENDGATAE